MKSRLVSVSLLRVALFVGAAMLLSPATGQAADAEKSVAIVSDTMSFDVTKITASPGQALHVQLKNQGALSKGVGGHNWILLDSGGETSAYVAAAANAVAENYEPKALKAHVLASIPLLGPKESGEVTFNAPSKPGKYPFLCSFPGHFAAGMRGELIVK